MVFPVPPGVDPYHAEPDVVLHPTALAELVRSRLDRQTFTFAQLHAELEAIQPGSGRFGWWVLDYLGSDWERRGWARLKSEARR